jgi:hypothetical protein
MHIRGIEGLSLAEIEAELAAGGRFVFFEYCLSLVFVTTRRASAIRFLRRDDHGLLRGLPFSLLSFFFGWWGVPWGLIYTPLTLLTNLAGGCDVTAQVRDYLARQAAAPPVPAADPRTPPCAAS